MTDVSPTTLFSDVSPSPVAERHGQVRAVLGHELGLVGPGSRRPVAA
jgi:hypothetical protein